MHARSTETLALLKTSWEVDVGSMVNKIAAMAFAGTAILVSPMASAAPVANGGFESGLAGWYSWGYTSSIGATALATGDTPYAPIEGNASALVVAMSAAKPNENWTCDDDRWNFNCPLPIEFTSSTAPRPSHDQWLNTEGVGYQMPYLPVWPYFRNGAYIARDIDVHAGDSLTWAWTAWGEAADSLSYDKAYLIATNGLQAQIVRYTQGGANSISFDQGGVWSIFIGLAQYEDNQVWGAIEVDSIELHSVPEPTSLALALGAVIALAITRRSLASKTSR
jgi:hypothetical protein